MQIITQKKSGRATTLHAGGTRSRFRVGILHTHLECHRRLIRFNLCDGIARREGIALLDVPLGDGAGFHGGGQGRHGHDKVIRQVGGRHVPVRLSEVGRGQGRYRGCGASGCCAKRGGEGPAGRRREHPSTGQHGSEDAKINGRPTSGPAPAGRKNTSS